MFDIDALGRHEAELLRQEAGRIADTETALRSVLDGEMVVPLFTDREAPARLRVTAHPVSVRRRMALLVGVAAAVAAIALLATRNGDDAAPADQPPPTVPITVPATPTPRALFGKHDEQFVPGTYFITEVDGIATPRIFVTLGEGWANAWDDWGIGGVGPGAAGYLTFSRPDAVFVDSCHTSEGFHPGPLGTLDGLVAALSEQGGWTNVTPPTDIMVNGYAGKTFQRTAPYSFSGCGEGGAQNYRFSGWHLSGGGLSYYAPGEIETLRVLDLNGTIVLISSRLTPEDRQEPAAAELAAAVLDSIRIEQT